MSQINISNLTFAYEGSYDDIFNDVSFQIDTDWKLGFCGRNGRGKTTFLQLLMGKYEYRGTISASTNFEYFPFPLQNKVRDTLDILQEIAADALLWQIQRELSLLSVDEGVLYRSFLSLSNGEQTKVLLAGLFLRENHFLLIDEPTNHLDMEARETVAQYLNAKAGFILVSHDRKFLDECTDHTLSINKNNIEVIGGNFSVWWEQKALKDAFELAQNEKLVKEISRLKSAAQQSAEWADNVESTKRGKGAAALRKKGHTNIGTMAYNAEKSRRMQQRRKNLERRQQAGIEEKSKLLKNIEAADALKIIPQDYHTLRLLSVENLTVSYDGRDIFNDVSFTLNKGERIALIGGNGSGKSSIIKLLCQEDIPHSGSVIVGSKLKISYVPQDASFLSGGLSKYARDKQIDETLFKTILRKLDFSRVQFEKDMQDFSAGQKKKVLLARSLCERAHVYIWDEPLNFIDVLSRIQIEELILRFKPTLLFVEHDRAFCDNIATKTVTLEKQGQISK